MGTIGGEVWNRPGLDLRTRSLCSIAVLAGLGRVNALELNIRMALNNGATKEEIVETFFQVAVYAGFAAAMKLPRKSPEEKTARRAALAEAARAATVVPLELAELCAEVVALGDQTCRIGNPNLVGDAAGGGSLARGALRICQLNIAANVGIIVDDAFVADTESRLAAAAKALRQADSTVDRHL